jgi:NADH dehydrogenase [ubiquinone] 1 alpha subcomplex assembly factor 6
MEELEIYAENTRSLMLYMNLHLLNIDDPNANLIASHLGRALGICDVLRKSPYYIGIQRGILPLDVLVKHNVYREKIYKNYGTEAVVVDEFYDVVLELAAYAKKHLEIARKIQQECIDGTSKDSEIERKPLPKHTHRAFLLA